MKLNITTLLLFTILTFAFSRESEKKATVVYEKVYLHTDRELYSTGDTIWFKPYLVSGMTHKPIEGYKNIYVQLVSPGGEVIASRLTLSINGESKGDIAIPDSIPDGQYSLRAYTKYLRNFDEKSLFHKRIWISQAKSSLNLKPEQKNIPDSIDVMFFPEGGNLVLNAVNHIAFKAVDTSGKGRYVKGQIVDENGELITAFESAFMGMGKFVFMPNENKSYYAKIDGFPEFNYTFDKILENGVSIHYFDKGAEVLVSIIRNIKKEGAQKFFLAASHKGVVLFQKKIELNSYSYTETISKNQFPLGISKISLLDSDLNMLAERLVFINDGEPNNVDIKINKDEFLTREKVKVSISPQLEKTDTVKGAFSVSVVNENYLGASGNSLSIKSYLLVDSELKGPVESPAAFFSDDKELSSEKKLDLLMMSQGWRSYYWDEIIKKAPEGLEGWDDIGLEISGYVKRLLRDKPVVRGEVVIGPFSRNFLFEETKTDKNGRFKIDRLYLKDQSSVMLNAKNERDRANTEIILDPLFTPETLAPADSINKLLGELSIPMMFYRQSYNRELAFKEFTPEDGSIMIGDVDVIGYKPIVEEDGHHRLYAEPDISVTPTEDDYLSYNNVFEYLSGKVAGVTVTGSSISIRGDGHEPLFLLDGIPDNIGMIGDISMQDVDRIEVLKSGYAMSAYGSQGGNGVIAVFTRMGDNKAEIEKYVKGRIELMVNGFQQPNQFYSPKYTLKNMSREEPDYRPTLFWSPEVNVQAGKAELDFFTCDDLSNYLVIAEGVSKNGKIFSAVKKFTVSDKTTAPKNVEKLSSQTDTILYEKVYLHIDRELYSPGDTLWFKSYLVQGLSNKPHRGYKNIYAQLISPSGEVIANRLLLSENGNAFGDFALNDSLPDGQYTVRAYTKYLQNFGEESYFHKRIWVSAPKSSMEIDIPEINDSLVVDAMFFPESGELVENVTNQVAFKVIGADGRGVKASGKIINEKGETITSFNTAFLGMGKFVFKPKKGEKYFATIDKHPEIKYPFTNIISKGVSMHYAEKDKKAAFTLSGDFNLYNTKNLFLLATHKGVELFYESVTMDSPEKIVSFDKQYFPPGISKISLYDENFNILSERLIFIDHNPGNSVMVEIPKQEYATREKIDLSLEALLPSNDEVAGLSVSVVSEDYLSSVGNNQNIKSYLLVDSDLKGAIESPATYFFDEENISSSEKLDLLMMVQGWRSYYWDDLTKLAPLSSTTWNDAGLSFTGIVTGLFNDKVVENAEVRLGPYSPQFLFEKTKTGKYGHFLFENLFMPDSAEVMVFATNEKGKNNVDVTLEQILYFESLADTGKINHSLGKINIPMKYYREIYMQQMAEKAFIPDSGSIMIGEVDVVAITSEDMYEMTKPFYNFYPTKSFIITEEDYKYESIYDFLLFKVDSRYLHEVDYEGNPTFKVYLDGRLIEPDEITSLQNEYMVDIYRLDYRRKHLPNSFDGGNPETFYFYRNKILKEFRPTVWGKAVIQVKGFQQPNQFYSPKYTLENINDKLPDYRPTLYWSPEILVEDGKANLEFFTCDNLSNYIVIVEGISKNGKICYGTGRFGVTKLYE